MTYANALKRTAEQSVEETLDRESEDGNSNADNEEEQYADERRWPQGAPSGPIKGLDLRKILEKLDPQVREAWEGQLDEAVFVHHLDGGYTPDISHKVHTIVDDLTSKHTTAVQNETE